MEAPAKPCLMHYGPELHAELQAMVHAEFRVVRPEELPPEKRKDVVALLMVGHTQVDGPFLDTFPSLKVIGNNGVGYNHIDVRECRSRGVRVGNTPGVLDATTADMAFALLLSAARRVVEGDRIAKDERTRSFDTDWFGHQVSGQTLGIVGMGNIGFQVARRGLAFDMQVLYHNRRPRPQQVEEAVSATYVATLHELLSRSDFVVVCVPASKETEKMIGAEEFSSMKKGAVFVNISRGVLVDHEALAEALAGGHLAAAGLDVTEPEPLSRDHPLLALPNVTLTPHTGGLIHILPHYNH